MLAWHTNPLSPKSIQMSLYTGIVLVVFMAAVGLVVHQLITWRR